MKRESPVLPAEAQERPIAQPLLEVLPAYESNMPASFRLSVLVPVYNERHVVATSLRRLLALEDQLISELEVIVWMIEAQMGVGRSYKCFRPRIHASRC